MKPLLKIAFLSIACFPCFCINNAAGSEDVIPGSQKIDRENSIINPIILTGIKNRRYQGISEGIYQETL